MHDKVGISDTVSIKLNGKPVAPQHELICPRCGVDRFKVPCPGPFHMCPIHGEAQEKGG